MKINRSHFFSRYRTNFGKLSQKQIDGLNFLLDKIEGDTLTLEHAAYVLATVKHETDSTFQPIKEKRGRVGTKIRKIQDRYWDSGFYGRGFVQITWKANYEKFGIAENPEAALEPEKAYEILSVGMRKGVFTGKKLTDYIIAGDVDYVQARRIVNGLDRANDIADIADKFETILRGSLVTKSVTEDIKREAEEVVEKKGPEETPTSPQPEQPGPQINIEHADQVKTDTLAQPIDGGRKDDPPKQASQGGTRSTIATIIGGITGIGTAIGGWLSSNGSLAMVGIICLTLVLLSWMYRQLIMDYFRLKYMSDPTKINVK